MDDELKELLLALEKPLRFASKNDFANLEKVRNLESLVDDVVLRALSLPLSEPLRRQVESLRGVFARYDSLSTEEKKEAIERGLGVVRGFTQSARKGEGRPAERGKAPFSAPSGERGYGAERAPAQAPSPPPPPAPSKPGKGLSAVPLQYVKGVGPKIAALFAQKGVRSIEDALFYLPRGYEDRRTIKPISQLEVGKKETLVGRVILSGKAETRSRSLYRVVIGDGTGHLNLVWFQYHEPYLRGLYRRGVSLILSGEVSYDRYSNSLQIIHPRPENVEVVADLEDVERESLHFKRIVPVYPLMAGLGQRRMRQIMSSVVGAYAGAHPDPIPSAVRERRGLLPLPEALARAHFPADGDEAADLSSPGAVYASPPHRTLSFYDFFLLELGLALRRRGVSDVPGIAFSPTGALTGRLLSELPFELTAAQRRVLGEIEGDMRRPSPMSRLLQGDVGCGKTIVAVLSMLRAAECGYQCALMAPTEILADQHFASLRGYLEALGIRGLVLKSGLTRREKSEKLRAIKSGEVDIVVGTHALIQEGVGFKRLGLVIIDEQHRFGVMQRAELIGKGTSPDVLVMTATPIPRTLAMTVYGDLDVSVIDEMPPGRSPVRTRVLSEDRGGREKAFEIIRGEVERGRQAYVVYPLIEESESPDLKGLKQATRMAEEFQSRVFPDFEVGLLHGRQKPQEKEEVMRRFVQREIDVLVTTTVIEVGVDVPNATVMVVENAERYGLSQLHQLRGRIGRGACESHCLLLTGSNQTESSRRRLSVIGRTTDGFRIAEADLMIRGPGDFMGTKQAGIPEFRFADILRDQRLLGEAREEAFRLVGEDPRLEGSPQLRAQVLERWGEKLVISAI